MRCVPFGQDRKEYIACLQAADQGEYTLLIDYMKKHGGKDPTICELLERPFYRKNIQSNQLASIVKAFLRQGANVNEKTNGHHPLHLAIKHGLEEISSILIKAGAN